MVSWIIQAVFLHTYWDKGIKEKDPDDLTDLIEGGIPRKCPLPMDPARREGKEMMEDISKHITQRETLLNRI